MTRWREGGTLPTRLLPKCTSQCGVFLLRHKKASPDGVLRRPSIRHDLRVGDLAWSPRGHAAGVGSRRGRRGKQGVQSRLHGTDPS